MKQIEDQVEFTYDTMDEEFGVVDVFVEGTIEYDRYRYDWIYVDVQIYKDGERIRLGIGDTDRILERAKNKFMERKI